MGLNKEAYIRYNIIDKCINNKYAPYPTIEDIIRKCEEDLGKTFSKSAIQKDIKAMKEDEALGFLAPIKYSRIHNGYYYTKENYSINFIPLNSTEVSALEAASDILNVFSGSRISESYNQAVKKIFASIKEKKQELQGNIRIIQTDEQVNHKGFNNFDLFYYAIANKTPLNFIHYSYSKRKYNSIIAHPFLLKEFQNSWYLLAYSEQHNELRTFGIDRINDVLLLDLEFHSVDNKIIDTFYDDIYGVYPIPKETKQNIEFVCNPLFSKYLKANPIHKTQTQINVNHDGRITFQLELIPSFELINFFKQYCEHIIIKSPIKLVKFINKPISFASWIYKEITNGK